MHITNVPYGDVRTKCPANLGINSAGGWMLGILVCHFFRNQGSGRATRHLGVCREQCLEERESGVDDCETSHYLEY